MKMLRRYLLTLIAAAAAAPAAATTGLILGPHALRADGTDLLSPESFPAYALDTAHPLFEWAQNPLSSTSSSEEVRGAKQQWYRIHLRSVSSLESSKSYSKSVGSSFDWTSGIVNSSSPRHAYDGPSLISGALYEWTVETLTSFESVPRVSRPARFRVSLLPPNSLSLDAPAEDPWSNTKWLGSNKLNVYRTTFQIGASLPEEATFYVCGLGFSSVSVNGVLLSNLRLSTAPWTNSEQINGFSALDVLSMLQPNEKNTITVALGYGWRNTSAFVKKDNDVGGDVVERVLRAQLRVSPTQVLVSTGDSTWSAAAGPVVSDGVYDGETFDARLSDLDNLHWLPAPVLTADASPRGIMVPWSAPPVQVSRVVKPIGITNPKRGIYVVDFGTNLAGVIEIKGISNCKEGQRLTFRHAEIMQHSGLPGLAHPDPTMIYQDNLRTARATDTYICAGGSATVQWSPRFTYHGFRFVEVDLTGAGGVEFGVDNIVMLHFHSALLQRSNATFESPTLNRLQKMALGAQRSNFMTVPTDCDQRDERLGWMGDANLSGDSMLLNFDATTFFKFFLKGIAHEIDPTDGSLTDTVPYVRYGHRPGDVSWTAAFPNLAHAIWKISGDKMPAKEYLASHQLQAHVANVKSQAVKGLDKMNTPYGDWCPPPTQQGGGQGPKPSSPYTSAFSYLAMVSQVADMADATGDTATSEKMALLLKGLNSEFNDAFLNATNGCYDSCSTQTSQALALALGSNITGQRSGDALARLLESIRSKESHFDVGIIGQKFLYDVLRQGGYENVALDILEQTDYPSIGYMFANPLEKATENLWELPDAPAEGTGMNSRNHHMWSSYSQYLIRSVAGMQFGDHHEQLMLRPATVDDLPGASASMVMQYGTVSLSWRNVGGVQTQRVAAGNGDVASLRCGAKDSTEVIEKIEFASFGSPRHAAQGNKHVEWTRHPVCHSEDSLRQVERRCLNKTSCTILSDQQTFAQMPTDCSLDRDHPLKLWVKAVCSSPLSIRVSVALPLAATAVVHFPLWRFGDNAKQVRVLESGQHIFQDSRAQTVEGLLELPGLIRDQAGRENLRVVLGSGTYEFEMKTN